MLKFKIVGGFVILLVSIGARAGVACQSSHPNFSSEARSLYQKFENLSKARKLGKCEVRIWTQDICDEKTQEFLYSGIGVTIGVNPSQYLLFGFEHYDSFLLNFKANGELILSREIQSFEMNARHFDYIYQEPGPGHSRYETRMTFDDATNSFTRLEFKATDSEQIVFEHLICEEQNEVL